MQEPVTQAIANGISWLLAFLGIGEAANVFNLLITVIAAVWFIKAICGNGRRKRKKQSDDWLYNAQVHQQNKYDYTDPVRSTPKPKAAYKPQKSGKVSPTGWVYDEEKSEWVPPKSLSREANTRWKWDEEKRIWIDLTKKK